MTKDGLYAPKLSHLPAGFLQAEVDILQQERAKDCTNCTEKITAGNSGIDKSLGQRKKTV
jgi:hypothetical protein